MSSTDLPDKSEPLDSSLPQLWMSMLGPDLYVGHPEIQKVIEGGPPLATERAKQIASEIIEGLRDHLPKVEAVRSTLSAVEELIRMAEFTSEIVARADEIVLADPEHFPTPDHELAHRVSRIARQIVVERQIVSDEDTAAIAPEAYRLAREAMGERGSLPTTEPQDIAPMVFLRLRQVLDGTKGYLVIIHERTKGYLELYLKLGLFPRLSNGRPSLDLAMFLAWLLQDATTRGMTDAHVAVFLESTFATLPGEWRKLAPSVSTVARWRLEREKIPEIPHHRRPHKRK